MSVFIRALWGDTAFWSDKSLYARSVEKIRDDVRACVKNQAGIQAINYVFGRENQEFLASLGFESRLLSDNPLPWKPPQMWRTKLETWRVASQEFREWVFVDWDMILRKPLPDDFWERLRAKNSLQAALMFYARRRSKEWRTEDTRKMPSAAWVYCNDPSHIESMIKIWETMPANNPGSWTEEICFAYHVDRMHGKWIGPEKWFELHEPYCVKPCKPAIPEHLAALKEHIWAYK